RRRHTRCYRDWSSDVCSSDLELTYYYRFLTAEEILRFYAKIFRLPSAEADRRIDQLLKLVELEGARKRPLKTYSKGMQQRVGLEIGRASCRERGKNGEAGGLV